MVVGALAATDLRLPVAGTGALVAALGLVLGYPNGLAMTESGQGLRSVIGSTAATFVVVTLVAALVASTSVAWVRIAGGSREAGSPRAGFSSLAGPSGRGEKSKRLRGKSPTSLYS